MSALGQNPTLAETPSYPLGVIFRQFNRLIGWLVSASGRKHRCVGATPEASGLYSGCELASQQAPHLSSHTSSNRRLLY